MSSFFLALYARTTRYEEAFFASMQKKASVASLPRPCLKLVFLSFRGYFGEIESEETKPLNISNIFLVVVQSCVSVSASNFQVLTRKRDGAINRALGNISVFWLAQLVSDTKSDRPPCFVLHGKAIHANDGTEAYGERKPALQ